LGHVLVVVENVVDHVHPHETEVVQQVHWDGVPRRRQALDVAHADFRREGVVASESDVIRVLTSLMVVVVAVQCVVLREEGLRIIDVLSCRKCVSGTVGGRGNLTESVQSTQTNGKWCLQEISKTVVVALSGFEIVILVGVLESLLCGTLSSFTQSALDSHVLGLEALELSGSDRGSLGVVVERASRSFIG